MNYTDLDAYPFAWVFRRADLAISDEDKAQIRPLARHFAKQVWQREVSDDGAELDRLGNKDWPRRGDVWQDTVRWDDAFDSDEAELPEALSSHLVWNSETIVYICYDPEHILETRYGVFKRCWKAFLFAAEETLVVGRKRKETLWFTDETSVRRGIRP
ncbi:conserved hypothetical protein [Ferrimonas balearica DSM 9799]|uniref:DUF2947 domain-containing protein n=1 Tax=Ferrimonas balearica (strain DSM 9799 / CCM 4581 / KCTC 23876 / PAT) TaxID=550540 RepID=E1SR68_FERBD|nr:DUF2947 domain-containing protein [Ferrimonas balearica]ADN74833.1 conserved hypothetical protein [Ferrimonas balearica DSM 9799]MBW3140634.1 DUF2947 domain-containing protein [Ferrimonas balearica]MBW3165389.1 DUF2947 domain-containing protein [Ferrimonas balearica]MBY5981401.1 DUF2947 domain-containing protein [Ferrimonas balearica]MBY6107561.1 DUF2947 domain-containing protein [Ferrimonas balearica]